MLHAETAAKPSTARIGRAGRGRRLMSPRINMAMPTAKEAQLPLWVRQ
jgi:hypothetical protein